MYVCMYVCMQVYKWITWYIYIYIRVQHCGRLQKTWSDLLDNWSRDIFHGKCNQRFLRGLPLRKSVSSRLIMLEVPMYILCDFVQGGVVMFMQPGFLGSNVLSSLWDPPGRYTQIYRVNAMQKTFSDCPTHLKHSLATTVQVHRKIYLC